MCTCSHLTMFTLITRFRVKNLLDFFSPLKNIDMRREDTLVSGVGLWFGVTGSHDMEGIEGKKLSVNLPKQD